ncbi:MAG: hypothetical protein ACM3WV_02055 [Bacillota bacterium]
MWRDFWYRFKGLLLEPNITLYDLFQERRYVWSWGLGLAGIWCGLPDFTWLPRMPWLLMGVKLCAAVLFFFAATGLLTFNFKIVRRDVSWKDFSALWGFSYLPLFLSYGIGLLQWSMYKSVIGSALGPMGATNGGDNFFPWLFLLVIAYFILSVWYVILCLQIMRIVSRVQGWRYWAGVFLSFVLLFCLKQALVFLGKGGIG